MRARFSIEAEDRKGEFILVFPNASFEPVNHTLSQAFTGGQLGGDSGWRTKMSTSLEHTNIRVNAVMGETEVSLRDVLSWTPGTTLDFGMQADDPVMVVCAEKHIAMAEVGRRRNGKVALKITEQLYEEEELSNVLGY